MSERAEVGIPCESVPGNFDGEVVVEVFGSSGEKVTGILDEINTVEVDGDKLLVVELVKEEGDESLVILPGRGAFIQASSIRVPKSSVVELPGWDE